MSLLSALRRWRQTRQRAALARHQQAIAAASGGRILSGQRGYILIEEATVEEANHAASWLEHQAAAMQQRARDIRRAMHKRSVLKESA